MSFREVKNDSSLNKSHHKKDLDDKLETFNKKTVRKTFNKLNSYKKATAAARKI